jgi:hypothetical protein
MPEPDTLRCAATPPPMNRAQHIIAGLATQWEFDGDENIRSIDRLLYYDTE